MPLYPYVCKTCFSENDHLQKYEDAPIEVCPDCGANTYTKLIGLPSGKVRECKSAEELGVNFKSDEQIYKQKAEIEKRLPWWRNGTVEGLPKKEKPINVSNMSEANVEHYVQTGEVKKG